MKQKTLLLLLIFANIMGCMAQNQYKSMQVSYGYLSNSWGSLPLRGSAIATPMEGALMFDVNLWQIGKHVTGGFFVGLAPSRYTNPFDRLIYTTLSCRYGIRAQLHLLPLMGKDTEKWDFSLDCNLGSLYCHGSTLQTEYGLGCSASYYLGKKIGINASYLWGKYWFGDLETVRLLSGNKMVKCGISYRF